MLPRPEVPGGAVTAGATSVKTLPSTRLTAAIPEPSVAYRYCLLMQPSFQRLLMEVGSVCRHR